MVGSVAREWSVGRGAAGLGPTGGQTVRVWLVGLWREAGLVTNGGSRIVGHCVAGFWRPTGGSEVVVRHDQVKHVGGQKMAGYMDQGMVRD